jgi:glycosyltransferase involved in cell wall biosynthesis
MSFRFVFVSAMEGSPWGGSEELWSRTAFRLYDEGHRVAVSVSWRARTAPVVAELAARGITILTRPASARGVLAKSWRKLMRTKDRDFKWLLDQNADLIVISQGGIWDGLEWMKYCHAVGLPFVAVVQANAEIWWPADKLAADLGKAYRAARKIFCVSRHNLALLEKQIGESLPNGVVTWNPWNVAADHLPGWPAEDGVWKIACVARLEAAAKGQDILLEAMAAPQWADRRVELNLYGSGPCENSLRRLAAGLQLSNVNFRGHVPEVTEIWRENHLLVLPSRYEGLPLALVEAMWCARPAIVTDVGGSAELCLDGKTGFVVAAPAKSLLEQTLEMAWGRRSEWRKLGEAARARVEQLIPSDPIGDFCKLLMKCVS